MVYFLQSIWIFGYWMIFPFFPLQIISFSIKFSLFQKQKNMNRPMCRVSSFCSFTSEISAATGLLKVTQHVLGHLNVSCLGLCIVPQWYCIKCPSSFISLTTDLCRRQKVLQKHGVDSGNVISHWKDTFRALSEMASCCLLELVVCLVF